MSQLYKRCVNPLTGKWSVSCWGFLMGVDHRGNITLCCALAVIPHFISESWSHFTFSLSFSCVLKLWCGSLKIQCAFKEQVSLGFKSIYPIIEHQTDTVYKALLSVCLCLNVLTSLSSLTFVLPLLHHLSALPVWLSMAVFVWVSCPSPFVSRSCVYRILPEQPARSVFLHASASISPLGSAQSRHGVWCLLSPRCQLGPQDSGQCGFHPSSNNNVRLQYTLRSSRG